MTFEQMRRKIVEEDKFATSKDLSKLLIKLGLSLILSAIWLGLATIFTVGMNLYIIVLFCLIALFLFVCNYASESEETFKKVRKITSLWRLHIIIIVGLFVLLKLFYFI